ncbi:hypothetical protein BJ875DRAFT_476279 [Amylocarpus encephaloides]|uniref:Uncharacterized protein n=1 Tax=Amylocarpus encephaloides TaxID=45428 RepID=A0A9P7Y892_9HELO|nr:hypothetical protein BJ875DRAFT_476279 [Amylocarpus encephaloides]
MSSTIPPQSPSSTSSITSTTTTTNALTTLFTPPPACTTQWIAFSRGDIYSPKETYIQRIHEDSFINFQSCYPTSTRAREDMYRNYLPLSYSPGICPAQYTTADSGYSGGLMKATCCASGFTLHTTNTSPYPLYSTYRYCISSYATATSALILKENGLYSTVHTNNAPVAVGPGIAVLDAVTVAWEVGDLPLFPSNARPVVGTEVLADLGEAESSLVVTTTEAAATAGAVPTSSRSEGCSPRVRRHAVAMGILYLILLGIAL